MFYCTMSDYATCRLAIRKPGHIVTAKYMEHGTAFRAELEVSNIDVHTLITPSE
jgi:hypothetical protein